MGVLYDTFYRIENVRSGFFVTLQRRTCQFCSDKDKSSGIDSIVGSIQDAFFFEVLCIGEFIFKLVVCSSDNDGGLDARNGSLVENTANGTGRENIARGAVEVSLSHGSWERFQDTIEIST